MTTSARCLAMLLLATLLRGGVRGLQTTSRWNRGSSIIGRVRLESTASNEQDLLPLSPVVSQIEPSKTIEIHALTQSMRAAGEDVVSLCVGEPDFAPPDEILEATKAALDQGATRYTAVSGTGDLRALVSQHLAERKGTQYASDEILVCNGAKQAVYQAVLATCGPGDEVVVPAPYWPSYPEIVRLAGATPVIVTSTAEQGFILSPEQLEAVLTPRTRMLILCNPSNPTGAVHDRQALEALASVLKKAQFSNVWVMADEIYERIVYDVEHVSFASLEGMWHRTLTVNGFSKAYAMTGFRLGYLAAPRHVVRACTTLQGQLTSCASSTAQVAAQTALTLPDDVLDPLFAQMRAKRDLVLDRLANLADVAVAVPDGAFYVLPEVSAFLGPSKVSSTGEALTDSTALCVALLKETGVALVPGDAFGAPQAVRISYAASVEELTTAMDRLSTFLAGVRDA